MHCNNSVKQKDQEKILKLEKINYLSRNKTAADVSTTGSVNWKTLPGVRVNWRKGNCQLKILYPEKIRYKCKILT